MLLEHWGHISREELNWLKTDLEKVGLARPVIIGFHHPIAYESVMVDNDQQLLEVIKPYNVVLWLQGHGHANVDWSVNGVPATMVGALYDGSYDIIHVTDDKLEITKRSVAKPKKKDELIKDESTPAEKPEVIVKPLMTIPLKKRPAPQWSATANVVGDDIDSTASAPAEAVVGYRVDTEKMQPLESGKLRVPTTQMAPGEHTITVEAGFPDKRKFQIPLAVKIPARSRPTGTSTSAAKCNRAWSNRAIRCLSPRWGMI